MKNHINKFGQYIKESMGMDEYTVTVEMAADTVTIWADTLAELAEIAPNCYFSEFTSITPDNWDVTLVGSEEECEAIANYWNELTGGNEVIAEPFTQRRQQY